MSDGAAEGDAESVASAPPALPTDEELRPTLVLLPGMLGDDRLFESVMAELGSRLACRPMRIDVDDAVGEMAESVLAAAPRRFALAGHSLGGIVALEMVRRAPERISHLAVLNSSARPPTDAQLTAWRRLRDRVLAGEFAAAVEEQATLNLGSAASDATLRRRWTDMAHRVGDDGFLRQLRAQSGRHDQRPGLAAIEVPTLVVSGSDDAVCPHEIQAELAGAVPGAVHEVLDGAGHMTPLDHPVELARLLDTLLAV